MPTPPTWRQRLDRADARALPFEVEFWRLVGVGVDASTARQLATRPVAVAAGRRTSHRRAA